MSGLDQSVVSRDTADHKEEVLRSRMAAVRVFCQLGQLLDVDCTQEFYLLSLVKHAYDVLRWDAAKLQLYRPIVLNAIAQLSGQGMQSSQYMSGGPGLGSGSASDASSGAVGSSGQASSQLTSDGSVSAGGLGGGQVTTLQGQGQGGSSDAAASTGRGSISVGHRLFDSQSQLQHQQALSQQHQQQQQQQQQHQHQQQQQQQQQQQTEAGGDISSFDHPTGSVLAFQQTTRGLDPEAQAQINRVLWFRSTIINERRRILAARHGVAPEASPWVQLTTVDGRPFYYCFTDNTVADGLPGLSSDTRSTIGSDSYYGGLSQGSALRGGRRGDAGSLLHSLEECDLEVMTFTTMWTEGNTRRKATIRFHILSGSLEIKIDGVPNIYKITSPRRLDGKVPLSCWDLHVKGRIKCLGRTMTLLSCDQATSDWISGNAWRLIKAVDRLEEALAKHDTVPPGPPRPTLSQHGIPSKPLNETNLRQLMNRAALLRQLLARHRPAFVSMMEG